MPKWYELTEARKFLLATFVGFALWVGGFVAIFNLVEPPQYWIAGAYLVGTAFAFVFVVLWFSADGFGNGR